MSVSTPIVKPDVPGTVIQFIGQEVPSIPPSAADTAGLTVVHDWGPDGADAPGPLGTAGGPQLITSFAQWTALFGDSDTPGRTAVAGCFAGQGLAGTLGAGAIVVDRMVASDGAAAAVTIETTGEGSPAGLTLTALYKGSRGNSYSYTIDVDPGNAANDRLRLFYSGGQMESYVYAQTDVATLTTLINARSKICTADNVEESAARLTAGSASLVGGDDGADVVAADHLDSLGRLATKQFGILSCFDLEDSEILASYVSWIDAQAAASRPVRLVIGGADGDEIDDAVSRSTDCSDWHVVNVGVGTYHDDLLDKDLNTAQLAPRVAGILAACGQVSSLTFKMIAGLHANNQSNPDTDDVETAVTNGVVVFQFADSPDADLRISKGVTTWTTDTDPDHPVEIFGDPRLVGIMDNYVRTMKQWGDNTVVGDLPVTDDTRNLVRGQARSMEDDLQGQGLILPEDDTANPPVPAPWVVCEDPEDPSLADAIPYTFGWRFARTTNNILGQGTVQ